ncbi:MAG: CopG family antitoxin [Anaerolineales bacterium]
MKNTKTTKRQPKITSLSKSSSIAELSEFWDAHDLTDFKTRPVQFTVNLRARKHYVAVDADLINRVRRVAAARGLSTQSLVNLWLQERVGVERL